jgi:glucokinase
MILVGDIGGTNTRLAFVDCQGAQSKIVVEQDYPSHDFAGLEDPVMAFVKREGRPVTQACFAVAGPVRRGRAVASNLPWVVEAGKLAKVLALKRVALINDLEAYAYGIAALSEDQFVVLSPGAKDASGNSAVIAAGTGLGQAGLFWDGSRYRPFAAEGGHSDFAPRNETEIELLRFLIKRHGRVSYERVISGMGLQNIYEFLVETGKVKEPGGHKDELKAKPDVPAAISHHAMEKNCPVCSPVMDIFVGVFGAESGNVALKMMATGGLYIGGGIAPKILPKLQTGAFMAAFQDKGRMKPLLESMPVKVVMNQKTGLLGAARCALVQAAFRQEEPE